MVSACSSAALRLVVTLWAWSLCGREVLASGGTVSSEPLIAGKKHESAQEIHLHLLEQASLDSKASPPKFAERPPNAYFSRCLDKRWIKQRQVPRQRCLFYPTLADFSEKTRSTVTYSSVTGMAPSTEMRD